MIPEPTSSVLIRKGFNDESVSESFRDMFSYHRKINSLRTNILQDSRSSLRRRDNPPVVGSGAWNPKILILSDHPDKSELGIGHAGFTDYALYLMVHLRKLGYSMNDLYWTFAVKYYTDKMKMKYIEDSSHLLRDEILMLNPKVIIALGTTSISALMEKPVKAENVYDKELSYQMLEWEDVPIITVPHPKTFIDADEDAFRENTQLTWRSLKKVKDLI